MRFLFFVSFFVGNVLMTLGGSAIARQLGTGRWATLAVVGFAIGILFCAWAPVFELRRRMDALDRRLPAMDGHNA